MKDLFERIPASFVWIAIVVSLSMNVINIDLVSMTDSSREAGDKALCVKYIRPNTHATNTANGLFHSLIRNALTATVKRLGTPKELPSDRANVAKYNKYLSKFIVVPTPNCKEAA